MLSHIASTVTPVSLLSSFTASKNSLFFLLSSFLSFYSFSKSILLSEFLFQTAHGAPGIANRL